MSTPIAPVARWPSNILQADVPANNNARRLDTIIGPILSISTDAQPGTPVDGDIYIMTATHSGAQWDNFDPDDIATFYGGTWNAFSPANGQRCYVADEDQNWQFKDDSSGWSPEIGGAGAVDSVNGATGIVVLDAGDIGITDAGGYFTAGDVEGALQEIGADLAGITPGLDRSTVSSVSSASGVVTLDYSLGDYFELTLTENVTSWVIDSPPGSGKGFTLMVQITQGASAYTVAKPGTTAGGVALGVSAGTGDIDILAISSFDNGATLRSSIAKDFS